MGDLAIRVIKVGGSLFDLPELGTRLASWLYEQPHAYNVLVAGGGALVDQVREWQQVHRLSDESAHWMAIKAMASTARMLNECFPQVTLIDDYKSLTQSVRHATGVIFDTSAWLRECEPAQAGQTLPASWDTTSDSIAARLSIVLAASELVLLKSTLPQTATALTELADGGYVDRMFARLAVDLPTLRFVNLRNGREQLFSEHPG